MNILLLILFVVTGAGGAEAEGFARLHGGPERERGINVDVVASGGYVAVGSTRSFGAGEEDIYLVRTDAAGEAIWTRTFGGAGADFGWAVLEVSDGFVIAGFTESFGNGENDFYLVKTSADGEEQWSRTFGGEGNDRCWALIQTGDGGFLLAGETTSSGAGEEDCYLVRTDSSGTMLWSQTYGGPRSDRCFAVVEADDEGYVLAGQTFSEGAGDRDAYVLKTSPSGDLEWSRTYGGPASDVGHGLTKSDDGHFVVTGYTTSFATDGDDAYLIKVDPRGETDWTRVFALPGSNHAIAGEQAADGGFYLVGFSEHRGRGPTAALLIKTDAEGTLEWNRDLHYSKVGESFGYALRATRDGGCVFTGHAASTSAADLDLLLVEIKGDD